MKPNTRELSFEPYKYNDLLYLIVVITHFRKSYARSNKGSQLSFFQETPSCAASNDVASILTTTTLWIVLGCYGCKNYHNRKVLETKKYVLKCRTVMRGLLF